VLGIAGDIELDHSIRTPSIIVGGVGEEKAAEVSRRRVPWRDCGVSRDLWATLRNVWSNPEN
jgi:hypothetical protein